MLIWLIQPGEELPIDPGNPRLLRTGILAEMLAGRGHEVIYWTSTFSHARKTQRYKTDTNIDFHDNYRIKLLRSPSYPTNISIRRIYNHIILGRRFTKQACYEKKPEIILCSMPTIELSLAATEYGRKSNVPVVLELRDMWPDIFLEAVPGWARPAGRFLLRPMFSNLKKACENATAIFGITAEFLEWGLKYAGRKRNSFDAVFYHGYSHVQPDHSEIAKAESFWRQHGIHPDKQQFIACFFGYFGRQFEIETVLEAAKKLTNSNTAIRFVLCGDGDNFERYKSMAKDLNNVVLPGFVGHPEIWTLMKMASVGLAPYKSTTNFTGNLPNKVGEYLSAGLPIISSLSGTLEHLLWENKCGITYLNSDVEKLASSLLSLSNNRQEVEKMSYNADQLFRENFSSNIVYLNMTNHLDFIYRNYSGE